MSSFTLDKTIFNLSLYKSVRDTWFEGVPLDAADFDFAAAKRWFQATPEEKAIFDSKCRDNFAHALEAIGPEKFPEPTAEPFLQEIKEVAQSNPGDGGATAAWSALAIVLLVDQMTRHIFRKGEGLVKVYNHYDKIAYSLVRALFSADSPIGRPDHHPQWRYSPPHRTWFYLPFIHSEDIEAHDIVQDIMDDMSKDAEEHNTGPGMKKLVEGGIKGEKEHRDILEKFGRYPHRNLALGRESTDEEKKFLSEGGSTFGVSQDE
ncbi:DUF924-domain-containing protein [Lojkania enalia]|uniref:DUF924-domain-containing protein n=1 Tax=Lojkania enalia TaxID=147567 RepID=A0A9P4NC56_9PLEO|nr:DUF924-domain-containing protein [Didymosphaeria enalia]